MVEAAKQYHVTIHRVSQGSGIMLHTDDEIREMLRIGRDHGMEVSLFVGPRAAWDVGAQVKSSAGGVLAGSLRGADQLTYALADVRRGCDLGLRGILVYLIAYVFTNLGLFIAVIAYSDAIGSDEIADYAGMIQRAPGLALAMVIFFLSLAGIPPTAGFIGKFLVFGAALDAAKAGGPSQLLIWLAIIGAVNSVVSVGYYFNIVRYMFFMPPKDPAPVHVTPTLNWSLGFATVMTLVMGIVPQPFITFAEQSVRAIFKG